MSIMEQFAAIDKDLSANKLTDTKHFSDNRVKEYLISCLSVRSWLCSQKTTQ